MRRKLGLTLVLAVVLLAANVGLSWGTLANNVYVNTATNLYLVTNLGGSPPTETSEGAFKVGTTATSINDIAWGASQTMYGVGAVDKTGQLYTIDATTAALTAKGSSFTIANKFNSLEYNWSDNKLYAMTTAATAEFWSISAAGAGTDIGALTGYKSAGDLAYRASDQALYAILIPAAGTYKNLNVLATVSTAGAVNVLGPIQDAAAKAYDHVDGLTFFNGTLYGYTSDKEQLILDPSNGQVTGVKTGLDQAAIGATAVPWPSTLLLVGTALFGIGLGRKKFGRSRKG